MEGRLCASVCVWGGEVQCLRAQQQMCWSSSPHQMRSWMGLGAEASGLVRVFWGVGIGGLQCEKQAVTVTSRCAG